LTGSFGLYNSQTLLKNPDFSLFLAALSKIGLPYNIYKLMVYYALGIIALRICDNLKLSKTYRILVLFFVVFSPVLLSFSYNQPLRELTQLVLFSLLITIFPSYLRYGNYQLLIGTIPILFLFFGLREENIIFIIPIAISCFWIFFTTSNIEYKQRSTIILLFAIISLVIRAFRNHSILGNAYGYWCSYCF